ncbi:Pectinesterase [Tripterygium wilfordii]|uniref:pectinesterase n=1 Tax=Tripterygium wilfordii TaxID=458696 RepID=A0A7J7BX35_TRIWF|nr:putative pectinesterase 63 [Tripterygium wilfordii]KAF5726424.1 Pectinesterase [Tripterygium wilfordii]
MSIIDNREDLIGEAMDSKPSLHKILFLVCIFNLYLKFSSGTTEIEEDYNSWVSWNVNNHRTKTIMRQNSGTTGNILDHKLMMAEINKTRITVSQDGTGDFNTIKEALDSIPKHNTRRVILNIKPGVYREKINITKDKPFVTFLGDSGSGNELPTISWNDKKSSGGKTLNTASVMINADYFVAINMKFANTAHYESGKKGEQAVAVRVSGNKAAFYNCSFYGHQDTLYDHKGLHYFKNCFIQGSVDFICGHGRSLYEKCELHSTAEKVGYATAQRRSKASMISGFSFKDCLVTGSGSLYLGRAWGDYSRVVFSYTFMDKIVIPPGWEDDMGDGHSKNHSKIFYGEYKCTGPGSRSNVTGRVPWSRVLTDKEAKPFIGVHFVEGETWLSN